MAVALISGSAVAAGAASLLVAGILIDLGDWRYIFVVAAAYALSGLCARVPALLWVVGRRGAIRAHDIMLALLPSSLAAILVLGAIYGLRQSGVMDEFNAVAGLAIAAGAATCLALGCYAGLPKGREALRDLAKLSNVMFHRRVGV